MTKRNPESSRKASENRADHASIIEVSSASTQRLCSIEVIKLGVDTGNSRGSGVFDLLARL
jgi:hypothetical protein